MGGLLDATNRARHRRPVHPPTPLLAVPPSPPAPAVTVPVPCRDGYTTGPTGTTRGAVPAVPTVAADGGSRRGTARDRLAGARRYRPLPPIPCRRRCRHCRHCLPCARGRAAAVAAVAAVTIAGGVAAVTPSTGHTGPDGAPAVAAVAAVTVTNAGAAGSALPAVTAVAEELPANATSTAVAAVLAGRR